MCHLEPGHEAQDRDSPLQALLHLEEEHCTVGLTCYRTPTIHDDMTIYRREIARI